MEKAEKKGALYFPVFYEDRAKVARLSEEQKAKLLDSLFAFAMDGEYPESEDPLFQIVFETMTEKIIRIFEKKGIKYHTVSIPIENDGIPMKNTPIVNTGIPIENTPMDNTGIPIENTGIPMKNTPMENANANANTNNNYNNIYNKGVRTGTDAGQPKTDRELILEAIERQGIKVNPRIEEWVDGELEIGNLTDIIGSVMNQTVQDELKRM